MAAIECNNRKEGEGESGVKICIVLEREEGATSEAASVRRRQLPLLHLQQVPIASGCPFFLTWRFCTDSTIEISSSQYEVCSRSGDFRWSVAVAWEAAKGGICEGWYECL